MAAKRREKKQNGRKMSRSKSTASASYGRWFALATLERQTNKKQTESGKLYQAPVYPIRSMSLRKRAEPGTLQFYFYFFFLNSEVDRKTFGAEKAPKKIVGATRNLLSNTNRIFLVFGQSKNIVG